MSPLTWQVDCSSKSVLVTAHGKLDPPSIGAFSTMLAGRDSQGAMLIDISAVPTAGMQTVQLLEAVQRRGATGQDTALVVAGPAPDEDGLLDGYRTVRPPMICCLADTKAALLAGGSTSRTLGDALLPIAGAARQGRNVVTEACVKWDRPELTGTATMVATELINYAAESARTMMDLTVAEYDRAMYIGVRHGTSAESGPSPPGNYGFCMINSVTTHWGFLPAGDDTMVWARLFI
jgi:hypothetical protein